MKLNQLLTNKKIVIGLIAVLFVSLVGIAILVTNNSQKTSGKDNDTKTEQGKEETGVKDDEGVEDSDTELEVLQPDVISPETSTDVPGDWGDTSETSSSTGNTDAEDQTGNGGGQDNQEQNVLQDNIDWGNIY